MWAFSRGEALWIVVIAAVVCSGIFLAALADKGERDRCAESGGRYVTSNCRTVYMTQMIACGANCWMSTVVPIESCDHECVVPAAPRPEPPSYTYTWTEQGTEATCISGCDHPAGSAGK